MAAPYISGLIALYLQVHKSSSPTPSTIRAAIRNTGNPVLAYAKSNKNNNIAPVVQQGGGLVNAPAAIFTTTTVSPSVISLNDTVRLGDGQRIIVIRNGGDKRVTYQIKHLEMLESPSPPAPPPSPSTRRLKAELYSANTTTPLATLLLTSTSLSDNPTDQVGILADVNRNAPLTFYDYFSPQSQLFWKGKVYQPAFSVAESLGAGFADVVAARRVVDVGVGKYFVKLSAARPFGNVWDEKGYDVWESDVFEIDSQSFAVPQE
ncbi:hypothetical protein HDV00_010935 [Rhizophlyctis rosea]|nr:hypothetical protein HDV00_010935 [Rhizophlyctis rosea]